MYGLGFRIQGLEFRRTHRLVLLDEEALEHLGLLRRHHPVPLR